MARQALFAVIALWLSVACGSGSETMLASSDAIVVSTASSALVMRSSSLACSTTTGSMPLSGLRICAEADRVVVY